MIASIVIRRLNRLHSFSSVRDVILAILGQVIRRNRAFRAELFLKRSKRLWHVRSIMKRPRYAWPFTMFREQSETVDLNKRLSSFDGVNSLESSLVFLRLLAETAIGSLPLSCVGSYIHALKKGHVFRTCGKKNFHVGSMVITN